MRCYWVLAIALILAALPAMAQPPAASGPAVTITLGSRQGRVTPQRSGFNHTGGGNIDVAQPAPDTVVITMSGVAVAGGYPCNASLASLAFDLIQQFDIGFEKPEVKSAKLILDGRVIGLLRSHRGNGCAQHGPGQAGVYAVATPVASLVLPPHAVTDGQNVSVNDREGPVVVTVGAGRYTFHQVFAVTASYPQSLLCGKAASAEFAPDPALDPLWISYWEPFHGVAKKDFGFQVSLKVAP